jgi:hypothetical protein
LALTIPQGKTGTLSFDANMAGINPADVNQVQWSQPGAPTYVKLIAPDQVQGVAVGSGTIKCVVHSGTSDKQTYEFPVECVSGTPDPPPRTVPITIFVPLVV